MTADIDTLIAIGLMALATYMTRAGGFWLMGYVPITPRIERFLTQMAGGVLIAIITGAMVRADLAAWIAFAAIAGLFLAFRKPMLALFSGVALAALLRHLL